MTELTADDIRVLRGIKARAMTQYGEVSEYALGKLWMTPDEIRACDKCYLAYGGKHDWKLFSLKNKSLPWKRKGAFTQRTVTQPSVAHERGMVISSKPESPKFPEKHKSTLETIKSLSRSISPKRRKTTSDLPMPRTITMGIDTVLASSEEQITGRKSSAPTQISQQKISDALLAKYKSKINGIIHKDTVTEDDFIAVPWDPNEPVVKEVDAIIAEFKNQVHPDYETLVKLMTVADAKKVAYYTNQILKRRYDNELESDLSDLEKRFDISLKHNPQAIADLKNIVQAKRQELEKTQRKGIQQKAVIEEIKKIPAHSLFMDKLKDIQMRHSTDKIITSEIDKKIREIQGYEGDNKLFLKKYFADELDELLSLLEPIKSDRNKNRMDNLVAEIYIKKLKELPLEIIVNETLESRGKFSKKFQQIQAEIDKKLSNNYSARALIAPTIEQINDDIIIIKTSLTTANTKEISKFPEMKAKIKTMHHPKARKALLDKVDDIENEIFATETS